MSQSTTSGFRTFLPGCMLLSMVLAATDGIGHRVITGSAEAADLAKQEITVQAHPIVRPLALADDGRFVLDAEALRLEVSLEQQL